MHNLVRSLNSVHRNKNVISCCDFASDLHTVKSESASLFGGTLAAILEFAKMCLLREGSLCIMLLT